MDQSYLQPSNGKPYLPNKRLSETHTAQNKYGKLKWAILHGHKEMINSLLEENTRVDYKNDLEEDFRSPLHSSIYLGDSDIVEKLLNRGASPNVYNANNETALMLAAKFEKTALVDLLLSYKRLENCISSENFTHLHIACMRNRVDIVEKFAIRKEDINTRIESSSIYWSGYTPLHFAVKFQCIETVKYLLSVGADITISSCKGLTPLHLADMIRNERIIDMILVAHKNVAQNPGNWEGLSHFHIACTRNNPEILKCFIKNGVKLNGKVEGNSKNWRGYSGIDFAIYYDCIDNIKLLLLEGGREIFPSMSHSDRVINAYHTGNIELVKLILSRDEFTKMKYTKLEHIPALHHACLYSDMDTVKKAFMKAPDQLNAAMWQGNTSLHTAVLREDFDIDNPRDEVIEFLLKRGANFNLKNFDGKSPLHLAYDCNQEDTVTKFLNRLECITENPVDNEGFSHLHIACIENEELVVARFIELGVDINIPVSFDSKTRPGCTPLHLAVRFKAIEVVCMLLKHGASYFALDKDGLSAFDFAFFDSWDVGDDDTAYQAMREILLLHSKKKIDSFNDRDVSLLHLLSSEKQDRTSDMKNFIREHPGTVNKAIHSPNEPWDGYTPLHFAMLSGNTNHARLLVEKGANIFSQLPNGDTPFHLTSDRIKIPKIPMNSLDFAKMRHNPFGTKGISLFHVACCAGNMKWIKYFLDQGIDPNLRTMVEGHEFYDKTALHLATRYLGGSKLQVISLLLKNGANASARDYCQETPLHYMSSTVQPEVIDLLINHGADVNSRNSFLETPLFSFCQNYSHFSDDELSRKIVTLLNHGADMNLADESGVTPLSFDTWTEKSDRFPLTIEVLMKHMVKLKLMGVSASEVNKRAYAKCALISHQLRDSLLTFENQCKKERDLMMQVRSDIYTILKNVMSKDPNGLSVLSRNDEFVQVVTSKEFQNEFPIFGPMLKMQLKRGQERSRLLTESNEALNSSTNITVPRECFEKISQSLDNADLNNMIMSLDLCRNRPRLKKLSSLCNLRTKRRRE